MSSVWATMLPLYVAILLAGATRVEDVNGTVIAATPRVLILGGGMAGVAAAHTLEALGMRDFILLEGSDRVGGRARQEKLGEFTVATGTLWAHSGNSKSKTEKLLRDTLSSLNVTMIDNDFEDYVVYGADGQDVTDAFDAVYEDDEYEEVYEAMLQFGKTLKSSDGPDLSMRAAGTLKGWNPRTPEQMLAEYFEIDFEYAAAPETLSQKFYNYMGLSSGAETMLIDEEDGWTAVVDHYYNETFSENDSEKRVYLNTVVEKIKRNASHVMVHTNKGIFASQHAIVTFSLGVLQTKQVEFEPSLPHWKEVSIASFLFAHYLHMYLQFPSAFWDDQEWILVASSRRGHYPLWQNFNKYWPGSNILQVTVTGDEAVRVGQLSDAAIQDELMAVLETIYGTSLPSPSGIVVPRFSTDPLFMGMYSSWPPGFSKDSHDALRASVGGRLHFAGEHTSYELYGYVSGAFEEGKNKATEVKACLDDPKKCGAEYRPAHENRGCTYKQASNYYGQALQEDGSCEFQNCPSEAAFTVMMHGWISAIVLFVVNFVLVG